ncbi:MAG: VIT family protein [Candidatus Pacebacteria bacterium]|nr:VIT family protein [Candidatus Paceibacterota bacterium]
MEQHTHIHIEPHHNSKGGSALNSLRAAVLGANDGIVSVSAVIVGVAGAGTPVSFVMTAGVAATLAGALSMAVGEYVSVSTQRDTERAMLAKERNELATIPDQELEELTQIYEHKGLTRGTAEIVAKELTAHDAFMAHAEAELGIDPNNLTNPWHAAWASGAAFFLGALLPLLAAYFAPENMRIGVVFVSVGIALMITGSLSAHAGGAGKLKATIRVVGGGILAMVVTYGVGKLFGISGI